MELIKLYIIDMIPYVLVGGIIYILVRCLYVKNKNIVIDKRRELWLGVFVLYIIALLSQTIMPSFNIGRDSLTGEIFFQLNLENPNASVNVIPFNTIKGFIHSNNNVDSWEQVSALNILANILFFLPLGFFVPILWKRFDSLKSIVLFGWGGTFAVEFIQYFIGRSSDIDDIILNVISIVVGYGIYSVLKSNIRAISVY